MKNFVLLITLILLSTIGYGQIDSLNVDSLNLTHVGETERIIDKYGGKLVEGFNTVVEKITPVAKEGFVIAVKLQIAKGIVCLLPLIFALISFRIFHKEYKRVETILSNDKVPPYMNRNGGPMDSYNVTPKLLISLILGIIMCLIALVITYNGITYLIAPEWFAIKEIIELFK